MAQVLPSMDFLHSRDDSFGLDSPSTPTDWRAKYNEAADMLSEARNELDDFIHSSKELEDELLRELERTEKTQNDLKDKISRLETDRDDWKSKFISLQTSHNTTVNSLHRERDTLRSEVQKLKVQLRDLELGNDDLERTERAISSSLADVEAKYSKALEEKIILEQELLNKAAVEEEAQRLRDDLRDANSEVQVLRDQLDQFKSTHSRKSLMTPPANDLTCSPRHDNSSTLNLPVSNEDQLLDTVAPADVLLADEVTGSHIPPSSTSSRPVSIASSSDKPLSKPSFLNSRNTPRLSTPGLHSRSNSLRTSPLKAAGSLPGRTSRVIPASRTTPNSSIPSKSKGVQMVSEMRAKVRSLEQKLHTRVPRLRSGTFDRGSQLKLSPNMAAKKAVPPESPGWVLVMEDSPPPRRVTPRRSMSGNSPPPSSFPTKTPQSASDDSPIANRIPPPRRSITKSRSSIPTPTSSTTSRGGSPDFEPPRMEVRSLNALKRTSVPMFPASGRISLGSSTDSRDGGLSSSQRTSSTMRGSMLPPSAPASRPLAATTLGNPTLKQSTSATVGGTRIARPLSMSARRTDTGPMTKNLPVDEYGIIKSSNAFRPKSARSGSVSHTAISDEVF
ncbi:NADH:ubiquinone oxidoreductase [Serendipita sp. 401]|nr:NADH:ubiquinone oxidoreductase [Serendipita sp. 401]KAG9056098.1 NADH:ubiquinone oxidoreductase [Serendipita sp. 407]